MLSRRGFLGAVVAVTLGAKAIVRGEPQQVEAWEPVPTHFLERNTVTGALREPPPYSIPAFINEHSEDWRFARDNLWFSDDELGIRGRLAADWKPTEVHKGPRGKMRKAPRDSAYYREKRESPEPRVRLEAFLDFIQSTGPKTVWLDKPRLDEQLELNWPPWKVPDARKMLA